MNLFTYNFGMKNNFEQGGIVPLILNRSHENTLIEEIEFFRDKYRFCRFYEIATRSTHFSVIG